MKISKAIIHAIAAATAMNMNQSCTTTPTTKKDSVKSNNSVLQSKGEVKSDLPATTTTLHYAPKKADSSAVQSKENGIEKKEHHCLSCGKG